MTPALVSKLSITLGAVCWVAQIVMLQQHTHQDAARVLGIAGLVLILGGYVLRFMNRKPS